MIVRIRKKLSSKFAIIILLVMVIEMCAPLATYALTSGPANPEFTSFEPAGTTDMVDPFTGDFNYNVDLFELPGPNGGYPINLAYHAGQGMETEASWTGLGWNLNAGAINRTVRGLPDDLDGDLISYKHKMRPDWTFGVNGGLSIEYAGANISAGGSLNTGIYYNSYRGFGANFTTSGNFDYSGSSKTKPNAGIGLDLSIGFDTQSGISIVPNVSASVGQNKGAYADKATVGFGIGYNSQRGLTDIALSGSYSQSANSNSKNNNFLAKEGSKKGISYSIGGTSTLSTAITAFAPEVNSEMRGSNLNLNVKIGGSTEGLSIFGTFAAFYNETHLKEKDYTLPAYGYLNLEDDVSLTGMVDMNREKDGIVYKQSTNLASPSMTYDIYNIQGQGIGGMFRPYRTEIGNLYSPYRKSINAGGSGGLEIGFGDIASFGFDVNLNGASTESGIWQGQTIYNFQNKPAKSTTGQYDYEPSYFLIHGDLASTETDQFNNIGNFDVVSLHLDGQAGLEDSKFVDRSGNTYNDGSTPTVDQVNKHTYGNTMSSRRPRTSMVQSFTNTEVIEPGAPAEYNISYINKPSLSAAYTPSLDDINSVDDINSTSGTKSINDPLRTADNGKKHIGAFSTLDATGKRYIYGLPVYNIKNIEETHSVLPASICDLTTSGLPDYNNSDYAASDKMQQRSETPAYATTYLLTSVLGADYVDINNDGPTDDDLGYWVKFNYVKTSDVDHPYKWRAPFAGATYQRNLNSKSSDDKANYMYGEKETYYLASAETKTHIAIFTISPRHDAYGAANEIQDYPPVTDPTNQAYSFGAPSFKLDCISLYSKEEYKNNPTGAKPLQTVHFLYDYQLCANVDNNDRNAETVNGVDINANHGKLTLKQVYFTYENSQRGILNPYKFTYNSTAAGNYNRLYQDRWGNLQYHSQPCSGNTFPTSSDHDFDFNYSIQNDADYPSYSCPGGTDPAVCGNAQRISDVSEWNLATITTPTGSVIKVQYEPDDYTYVQNKVAGEMFKIVGFKDPVTNTSDLNVLYSGSWHDRGSDPVDRRVYFKLTEPIPISTSSSVMDAIEKSYQQDLPVVSSSGTIKQIYFKSLMNIRGNTDGANGYQEYISGYVDYECIKILKEENPVTHNTYDYGYVQLAAASVGGKAKYGHPFSVRAWQYLQTNLPDLSIDGGVLNSVGGSSSSDMQAKIGTLFSFGAQVMQLFKGFYHYCFDKGWAQQADLAHSVIRLNVPQPLNASCRKKYGGDLRVKSITISDGWTHDSHGNNALYGVVYDYTDTETQNGYTTKISSGVVQYEPTLGGDENILRYAKHGVQTIPLHSGNDLFFEYPVNESYYPMPSLGYSKVTVMSLATYNQLNSSAGSYATDVTPNPPTSAQLSGLNGTGATVQEFYTAKDYPIITDETNLDDNSNKKYVNIPIPIPIIGQINISRLSAAQGYLIELNDMHGKPKAVTYYGQSNTGAINYNQPVSSVHYNYQSDNSYANGKPCLHLNNDVHVLTADGITAPKRMGVECEIFNDLRYDQSVSGNGGVQVNLLVLYFGIPFTLPPVWPSLGYSETTVRLAVTNKIIHRAGIMQSVDAWDGQSKVTTSNLLYDDVTGKPLETVVQNSFNNNVYNYKLPARWAYDGMGAAYVNAGIDFNHTDLSSGYYLSGITSSGGIYTANINAAISPITPFLAPGDEIMFYKGGNDSYLAKIVQVNAQASPPYFTFVFKNAPPSVIPSEFSNGHYDFKIMRSGRTNQLDIDAGNITALQDPLIRRYSFCDGTSVIDPATYYINFYNGLLGMLSGLFAANILSATNTNCIVDATSNNTTYWPTGIPSTINQIKVDITGGVVVLHLNDTRAPQNNCCATLTTPLSILYGGCTFNTITSSSFIDLPNYTSISGAVTNTESGDAAKFGLQGNSCLDFMIRTCNMITVPLLDKVINSSATTFLDAWNMDLSSMAACATTCSTGNSFDALSGRNYYGVGELGIWRPEKSYVYVDDRGQSNPVNVQSDGTYDNMPMFGWDDPVFFECPLAQKWRKTNSITDYSPFNFDVENKNILKIYSSALYGFDGKLPVAVAADASINEVGFESFEEYTPTIPASLDNWNNSKGNLTFVPTYTSSASPLTLYDNYDVLWASGNMVIIDKPYDAAFTTSNVVVTAMSGRDNANNYPNETVMNECTVTDVGPCSTGDPVSGMTKLTLGTNDPGFTYDNADRCWVGSVHIPDARSITADTKNMAIVNTKAHTGKSCMKVNSSSTFPQYHLKIKPSGKYVFSSWVSMDGSPVFSYSTDNTAVNNPYVVIHFYKSDNSEILPASSRIYPSGSIIEGWQKVEGTFTAPANTSYIAVEMSVSPNSGSYSSITYYDDIRVLPFNGSMVSYVYDRNDYKLKATLDANNYATVYSYDEQGNLYLIKRENHDGLATIKESRSHLKE